MVSKSSSGTFATLGSNVGSETKTLSVNNLPSHNHTFTGSSHTHSIPAHSHGLNSHTHTYSKSSTTSGSTTLTTNQIPAHTHGSKSLTGSFKIADQVTLNTPGDKFNAGSGICKRVGNSSNCCYVATGIQNGTYYNQIDINATHEHTSVGGGQGHTHSITLTSTNTGAASGNTANSSALTSGGTTQGGTIGNTGKGTALSVVQNSKVCIRWHRIS